jgi:hypothetical protein
VPPRPHRLAFAALALTCALAALLIAPRPAWPSGGATGAASGAGAGAPSEGGGWRWPLRGAVVGRFRLTPRAPFAAGQRRGIDIAAPPGSAVRAACRGVVSFAGPLPRAGRAISVRCGALVATYLHLADVAVGPGARVGRGQRLGILGPAGRLRLGARRAADRRGYLDPLTLLRDPSSKSPPLLGPAPRARSRRPAPVAQPHVPLTHRPATPRSAPVVRRLPWPAYPALALVATALPVGGLVHHRRRDRHRVATLARTRPGAL